MAFNPAGLTFPRSISKATVPELVTSSTRPELSPTMTMSKKFTIVEGKTLELPVSACNAFNQVRRYGPQHQRAYKLQGASYSNGFAVYNTPDPIR